MQRAMAVCTARASRMKERIFTNSHSIHRLAFRNPAAGTAMPRSRDMLLRALRLRLNATDGKEGQTGSLQVQRNLPEGINDETSGVEQPRVDRGPSSQDDTSTQNEQSKAGHPCYQAADYDSVGDGV